MAGKDFFELVKAIGESKSKQEEDRIVSEEVKRRTFSHGSQLTHFICLIRLPF